MHDLFLSYNRKDEETAKEITMVLRRFGFDVHCDHLAEIRKDSALQDALWREIDCSRCFGLLHSRHGLGDTQDKEAKRAIDRIPLGLDFKNIILGDKREVPKAYEGHPSIEGSAFLLVRKIVEWVGDRLVETKEPHQLVGLGHKHKVKLRRIVQPDTDAIYPLDWGTFGELLHTLKTRLDLASVVPDAIFGVNEGGLMVATFLAHKFHRTPIGYLKHGGPPPRRVVRDHFALPRITDDTAVVLLVDSELKTGSALRAVVPALRESYPEVNLQLYYAALFAQLNEKLWNDDRLDGLKHTVEYKDLLQAQGLEEHRFCDFFFGGLFGEGRIDPPYQVK